MKWLKRLLIIVDLLERVISIFKRSKTNGKGKEA